jgi:hypothetical protein
MRRRELGAQRADAARADDGEADLFAFDILSPGPVLLKAKIL